MKTRKTLMAIAAALVLAAAIPAAADASTFVAANGSGTTDLGFFDAGTYLITATGIADLVGPPGSGFDMNPDGTPTSSVTFPGYDYFNPDGSTTADGLLGPGGAAIKIGALMGSFIAVAPLGDFAPPQPNYFFLGGSSHVTLAGAGHLYAQVNDTFYSNDGGGFDVSVAAVPEPSAWALSLIGFGGLGAMVRRRRAALAAA